MPCLTSGCTGPPRFVFPSAVADPKPPPHKGTPLPSPAGSRHGEGGHTSSPGSVAVGFQPAAPPAIFSFFRLLVFTELLCAVVWGFLVLRQVLEVREAGAKRFRSDSI